jgi:hypothetical protein
MRFTIRDMFWLMAVVGMGVVVWINQRTTQIERASLEKAKRDLDSRRESMDKEWRFLEVAARQKESREYDLRLERTRFLAEQVPEAVRERSKQRSIELGAPQAKPLPPGYGENQN